MAGKDRRLKGSRSGSTGNSASSPRKESVIRRVVSFLKKEERQVVNHILKIPLNRPLGKVFYTVQFQGDPVTFYKLKDAKAFKKLLAISVGQIKSDIVRREITDDGYIPTYGDRK